MSDAEHTPGPWFVTKDYYNGMRISTVPTDASNIDGSGSVFENTGRGAGDISEEDAKYIVQCVNSHDALLDALKQAVCGNMGWKGIAEDVIAQAEKEG